jgi:hypothetical protein
MPTDNRMSYDASKKFRTYLFFLRHFDRAIRERRDSHAIEALVHALVNEQLALLDGLAAPAVTPATTTAVRKMLFNGWNSETVARMNSLFDLTCGRSQISGNRSKRSTPSTFCWPQSTRFALRATGGDTS